MKGLKEWIKMTKIAKLCDMVTLRTHNLTNLINSGVEQITIGRAEKGSNQLIQLGELSNGEISQNLGVPAVSKRHALIIYNPENDQYLLQDYSSTCGTTVDDKRLEPMKKHVLENNDSLKFASYGPVIFIVEELPERTERRDTAQSLPRVR